MSSFIVDKIEYVKAAGLMYGIEEAKRDKHQYFLDVCRREFEHAYLLNVISYNEQYGTAIVPDEAVYDTAFEEHRLLGKRIYECDMVGFDQPIRLRDLRLRLQHFFGSVLYQIENDTCHRTVSAWFYTCITKLYERELFQIEGWHGEVELQQELAELTHKAA